METRHDPNLDNIFEHKYIRKWAPFPVGGRPENDRVSEENGTKKYNFRALKVDDWFCGPKTFVFSFQKPSVRYGLNKSVPGLYSEVYFFSRSHTISSICIYSGGRKHALRKMLNL